MKTHCDRCDCEVSTITKMGGLICYLCRVILFHPKTPEYRKEAFGDMGPDIPYEDRNRMHDGDYE